MMLFEIFFYLHNAITALTCIFLKFITCFYICCDRKKGFCFQCKKKQGKEVTKIVDKNGTIANEIDQNVSNPTKISNENVKEKRYFIP